MRSANGPENRQCAPRYRACPMPNMPAPGNVTVCQPADDGELDQLPTRPLPRLSIDYLPTLPNLQAIGYELSTPGGGARNEQPTDELPTRILPAVRAIASIPIGGQEPASGGMEDYTALLRGLIKSSGIYALAAMASPLGSLVLAPFLTRYLTPADYGILTVLMTAIGLVAGVTQLGLGSAFFRAYNYDYTDPNDRNGVLIAVVALLCLISIPLAIGAAVAAPSLADLLFGRPALGNEIALAAGVVLLQNLTVPGFAWLRAENRAFFFALLAILNLLITLGGNIVLVGLWRWGIAGSLIAAGSGYAGVVICTVPLVIGRHARWWVRGDIVRNLLAFGGPQVLNVISVWVLQLSDRYLLSILGSLAQTASYAVAYSLGTALSILVVTPFALAWPTTMYAIAKRPDAPHLFKLVFRWFSMLLFFAAFALALGGLLLLDWLFPVSYHSAAPVIPIVAASTAFYGVYIVLTVGISISRKTWLASLFTTLAAAINVGLNLILIPHYGALGAAASTFIAYAALVCMAFIANQRIYPIPFETGRFVGAVLAGIGIYLGCNLLSHRWGGSWAEPVEVLGLIFYGVWLVFLGGGIQTLRKCRMRPASRPRE